MSFKLLNIQLEDLNKQKRGRKTEPHCQKSLKSYRCPCEASHYTCCHLLTSLHTRLHELLSDPRIVNYCTSNWAEEMSNFNSPFIKWQDARMLAGSRINSTIMKMFYKDTFEKSTKYMQPCHLQSRAHAPCVSLVFAPATTVSTLQLFPSERQCWWCCTRKEKQGNWEKYFQLCLLTFVMTKSVFVSLCVCYELHSTAGSLSSLSSSHCELE